MLFRVKEKAERHLLWNSRRGNLTTHDVKAPETWRASCLTSAYSPFPDYDMRWSVNTYWKNMWWMRGYLRSLPPPTSSYHLLLTTNGSLRQASAPSGAQWNQKASERVLPWFTARAGSTVRVHVHRLLLGVQQAFQRSMSVTTCYTTGHVEALSWYSHKKTFYSRNAAHHQKNVSSTISSR